MREILEKEKKISHYFLLFAFVREADGEADGGIIGRNIYLIL